MITEKNIKRAKKYCKDDYRKIPGYERALKESGKFDIHHVLELTLEGQYAHSTEELERSKTKCGHQRITRTKCHLFLRKIS